ncbi:nitroreductase [Sphingobacterium allocomposti]|jgi:nitroreductase/dihydropteridine reductase|uniref:Nitroreductase n=1 Tax=Sphingobacterium allocomposti TaxID=415956 RepID=A0A5S5DQ08_9SPHI|nr:NAD(P)H-dependent oxidoreductase [Sphingobacterium composti Yoo et al. 2007 non Ten et al. 2007]TYP96922.1 nitroreductase [Sphingobacterium composti Yoo et al. 2007 non Ten et al. 2007]HLS96961.1 NAD(P)H-dependent oxidoreductase [Sphingobacterium sp.]
MSLIDDLQWRYATKKMNGKAVQQEKVDYIVEAARLAPTSSGLQPYKVIEITNPDLKAKIQPIAFGQSQIQDASHLLVFAAYDEYTKERVDATFAQQEQERDLPAGFSDAYKNQLFGTLQRQTSEQHFAHAARQAYIGFGLAIAAAAEQRVDATPMEGFDNAQLDELLGLPALGLRSVTILALGYRDAENDWLVNLKKVRVPKEDFVIRHN